MRHLHNKSIIFNLNVSIPKSNSFFNFENYLEEFRKKMNSSFIRFQLKN